MVAADGEEALQLAHEVRPAAIALDVVLPRRDGWEVLNRLKREPATRDIPVLIISVVDQQEFGRSLGADEYLVKPLEAASLRAVVKRLVGMSALLIRCYLPLDLARLIISDRSSWISLEASLFVSSDNSSIICSAKHLPTHSASYFQCNQST